MVPPYILSNLSSYFGKKDLFERKKNIPPIKCSKKWRKKLNMYDVRLLLAVDCRAVGSFLKKSAIVRQDPGHEVSAADAI